MPNIFISYRHADTEGHVGRLYDHLARVFSEKLIFRDLDTLHGGEQFSSACEKAIQDCDVFLAVIGPSWLNIHDDRGRRLDNPADAVRREVATALKLNKRIIPVLVGGASVPSARDLPGEIALLSGHKAIEISSERFAYDVDRLVQDIGGAFGKVQVCGRALTHSQFGLRLEKYQVRINGDCCAEISSDEGVTLQIAAGVHNIYVRTTLDKHDRSNELRFELKGGQTMCFSFIRQRPNRPLETRGRIVLRYEESVITA